MKLNPLRLFLLLPFESELGDISVKIWHFFLCYDARIWAMYQMRACLFAELSNNLCIFVPNNNSGMIFGN